MRIYLQKLNWIALRRICFFRMSCKASYFCFAINNIQYCVTSAELKLKFETAPQNADLDLNPFPLVIDNIMTILLSFLEMSRLSYTF